MDTISTHLGVIRLFLIICASHGVQSLQSSEMIVRSGDIIEIPCQDVDSHFSREPGIVGIIWEDPSGSRIDFDQLNSRFSFEASKSSLVISGVKSVDSGEYTCVMKVKHGVSGGGGGGGENQKSLEDDSQQMFSYHPIHKQTLLVNDLPRFTTEGTGDVSIVTGSDATIPCQAVDENGNNLMVEWSKLGDPLNNKRVIQKPNGSLSIKNATRDIAGTYICSAFLQASEDAHASMVQTSAWIQSKSEFVIALTVKDSLIFDIEPSDQEVVAGQDAFFHCSADAPVIFWELHHQNGQTELLFPVQENDDQRVGVFPNKTLYIRKVRPELDPLGVSCVAESEKSHARLIIKDHYGCKVPMFKRTPNAVVAPPGSTILLRCTVENLDREHHRVDWYFRSKRGFSFDIVKPTQRRMILPSGDLQILFARDDDSGHDAGEYRCVVFCGGNDQDSVTAKVEVTKLTETIDNDVIRAQDAMELSLYLYGGQSAPYVVRVNSSEVELAWLNPYENSCGTLEFYCQDGTMSTWNRSLDCYSMVLDTETVKITGLKPSSKCMAAVRSRSVNSGFTTKLSPITQFTLPGNTSSLDGGVDKTGSQDTKVKAALKGEVVSYSQIQLFWTIEPQRGFMGFDVKCNYLNETIRELKYSIKDGSYRSFRLRDLNASTVYDCIVIALAQNGKNLVTDAVKLKTVPKPPPQPPTELSARPSGDASVLIEWVKPKVGPLDGEVTGYQVWCYNGENLIQQKVLKLGPDATQVSLPLPTEYAQIRIEVAAMSGQVVGIRSNPVLIKLSPNGGSGDSFLVSMFKKPWLLVVTGIVVWLLLFVICVFLIRRYVSEKFSGSGHINSQCCTMEAFRQGTYATAYDDPRSQKWMQNPGADVLTLHPQNPLSCQVVTTNFSNCVAPNEHFLAQNGAQSGKFQQPNSSNQQQCLADLDSRSVPNLVSDVGSDESYEEIATGGDPSPNQIVTSHSHCCGSLVPHYAVYDPKDYSPNLYERATPISQDTMCYSTSSTNPKPNSMIQTTSSCSPAYTVHLRPKMGSNALMLRTTSFHSCMANKMASTHHPPVPPTSSAHPVTILPRNSTIMPLVGASTVVADDPGTPKSSTVSPPPPPPMAMTTIPSYPHEAHSTTVPRQNKTRNNHISPNVAPGCSHMPAYYHELDPNRRSDTYSEGVLTGAYEELPNFSSQTLKADSRTSSHSSDKLCRKHSCSNKNMSVDSAC